MMNERDPWLLDQLGPCQFPEASCPLQHHEACAQHCARSMIQIDSDWARETGRALTGWGEYEKTNPLDGNEDYFVGLFDNEGYDTFGCNHHGFHADGTHFSTVNLDRPDTSSSQNIGYEAAFWVVRQDFLQAIPRHNCFTSSEPET